jgi:hypothetical protein
MDIFEPEKLGSHQLPAAVKNNDTRHNKRNHVSDRDQAKAQTRFPAEVRLSFFPAIRFLFCRSGKSHVAH